MNVTEIQQKLQVVDKQIHEDFMKVQTPETKRKIISIKDIIANQNSENYNQLCEEYDRQYFTNREHHYVHWEIQMLERQMYQKDEEIIYLKKEIARIIDGVNKYIEDCDNNFKEIREQITEDINEIRNDAAKFVDGANSALDQQAEMLDDFKAEVLGGFARMAIGGRRNDDR